VKSEKRGAFLSQSTFSKTESPRPKVEKDRDRGTFGGKTYWTQEKSNRGRKIDPEKKYRSEDSRKEIVVRSGNQEYEKIVLDKKGASRAQFLVQRRKVGTGDQLRVDFGERTLGF